jgi:hypothetical protein
MSLSQLGIMLSEKAEKVIREGIDAGDRLIRQRDLLLPKYPPEGQFLAANESDTTPCIASIAPLYDPLVLVVRQPPTAIGVELEEGSVSHRAWPW